MVKYIYSRWPPENVIYFRPTLACLCDTLFYELWLLFLQLLDIEIKELSLFIYLLVRALWESKVTQVSSLYQSSLKLTEQY